jgi:hypothetical protein
MKTFTNISKLAAMAAIAAIGISLYACEEKEKASKPTEAAVQQETPEPAETPKTADIAEMSPTFGRLLNKSPQGEAEYNKAAERYSKLSNPENPQKLSPADEKFLETFDEMFGYWDAVSRGCSWYCGGSVSGIAASSALKPYSKTLTYDARNIHDFDLRTAWVVPNYGIGEYVTYTFEPNNPRITNVIVVNGYIKSEKAWLENSRVKKLKMLVNGKPKAILNLADRRQEQIFEFEPLGRFDDKNSWTLTFEILEVYKGEKYEDTAITEIFFDGIDVH